MFYHYDGLGSTRALSNGAGDITDTYNYEAFGELLNSTGSSDNSYLFTGEQLDSFLGQQYLRARYYDFGIGRFTQQDTFQGWEEDPTTLHKYLYANADPVNGTDPSGFTTMMSISAGGSGFGILSTMALPSYSAIGKVAAGLVGAGLGYGVSEELKDFIARNAPAMHRILEQKRVREEERVEHRSRGRRVLYHYSSRFAVLSIGMFGVADSSPGYGSGRPAGFYATDIAPWEIQYTQEELSALFYGGNRHRDVSWFLAVDGSSFLPHGGSLYEYYSPSNTGEVNLDVITIGPNLMLPR